MTDTGRKFKDYMDLEDEQTEKAIEDENRVLAENRAGDPDYWGGIDTDDDDTPWWQR